MATTDSEISETSEDNLLYEKFHLKSLNVVKKLEQNELCNYIDKLHKIIIKKSKKLNKCKLKIKTMLENRATNGVTKGVQTEEHATNPAENPPKNAKSDELSASDAFSFVDEMRQAAEQAQNISNFIFEPTSGLYYDPKTGYYYNAEYGLYYDGNNGCYYSFNQAKNEFEFHSQPQTQDKNANANANEDGDDKDDDDDIDEVEFDEYGGVITDKVMLKQIKKQKKMEQQKKLERKQKKHKKEQKTKRHKSRSSSSNKEQRRHHKAKKRTRRQLDDEGSDSNDSGKRLRQDVEDGECSTSSSNSSDSDSCSSASNADAEESGVPQFKAAGRFQDIAKKYPPSLRIIVQETTVENLKIGSLHLITYKGGTLGREGAHDVIIADVNVSKCHLKFNYDTKCGIYKCIDMGSRNGTILNGTRMSESKISSKPCDLVHGSVIQIGQTKLLCHVHEGNSTCGLCEPGLLIEAPTRESNVSGNTVMLTHKEQLKKLQRKYGLENEKFVESKSAVAGNYNDRAATRRIKVGSTTDKEKTEVACPHTEISSENKGFKMLSKLGWSKGEALGKTSASGGLLAPINVVSNEGKTGLGCEQTALSHTFTVADKKKIANLKITQERYKRAEIFNDDTDDSN